MKKGKFAAFLGLFILPMALVSQESLPESREATLVETTSPTEVMVRAAGIGHHDPGGLFRSPDPEMMNSRAEEDALKAAIYFLLYSDDPPILQTDRERRLFAGIRNTFFHIDNLRQFIAWSSPSIQNRVKLNDTSVKVEKTFKINKRALITDLTNRGILEARKDITTQIGQPFVMVLPHTTDDQSPLELLEDLQYKKAAEVIESYLTARQYDVQVPGQTQAINEMQQTAAFMSGAGDDLSYQLAMAIGSDIYLTYTVGTEHRRIGSTKVTKASVGVRAYETTTARLLGSATGYSEERPGSELPLIEEAVNNAVDQILGRITAYWKEDLDRGIQYKLIVRLSTGFQSDEAEELSWEIGDILKAITRNYNENVITDQTLDYLVWCDPNQIRRSSDLYRTLKQHYQDNALPGTLERNVLNRKLLLLEVTL